MERMRLPVAAKIAFSTAGAATQMVGSPTPPQNPPESSSAGAQALRQWQLADTCSCSSSSL
jgi:hypothetical protein